ncbi:hypothetical protein AAK873_12205, partial [Heminiphilus faecis]
PAEERGRLWLCGLKANTVRFYLDSSHTVIYCQKAIWITEMKIAISVGSDIISIFGASYSDRRT